jgi:hypothetical protein
MLPLLIVWLAYALRLYHLDFQSIWWDEGHSIFVAAHPILQIPTLPAMDVHPPAYFSLLHLWLDISGRSEFALRYLSLIFSVLTVALLWRFGRLLASSLDSNSLSLPLLAALLAALSPMYVAYGQEVRSYAMITFLALASTYVLWRLLFPGEKQDSTRMQVTLTLAYIVLTAACLYTHYFTIFLLLFQNLMWLFWLQWPGHKLKPGNVHAIENRPNRQAPGEPDQLSLAGNVPADGGLQASRSRRWVLWLGSQAAILLLFAPQIVLAAGQVTSYTNPNLAPPGLAFFLSRSWQAYTVGLTIDPTPARWGMWAVGVAIVAGSLIWLATRPRLPRANFTFQLSVFGRLMAWLVLPLAAYYVVLQRQPSFEPRYMMLITPALFLLLAFSLGQAATQPTSSRDLRRAPKFILAVTRAVVLALPILGLLVGLHSYYTNEAQFKDDTAGVANWLAAETTSNDIIFFDVPHPFHYYAEQGNISAPTRYLFVDIHTAADILNREANNRERLFWVTWWGSDTDPRGVIPFLAEKTGQALGQQTFRGYQIDWFALPDDTRPRFSLPDNLSPVQATFGDVFRLDGMAFGGVQGTMTTTASEPVWATLHFTLLRDTDVDYKVSLRLRSEAGQIIAQQDRELLNDRHFRTSAWPPADPALNQAINVYMLPLAADTPAGDYQLEVVLYDSEPPYPSEGVSGDNVADGTAAILGRITVIP